jgi:hypothetical protein
MRGAEVGLAIGLSLALVSAVIVNWAYAREHDAAAALPRLTPHHPFGSARLLISDAAWRIGFAAETGGWLAYVAALRLAPLAFVQAIGAGGIAVLALLGAHGDPRRLGRRERFATIAAVAGLACISLSLLGGAPAQAAPSLEAALFWLIACAVAAAALTFASAGPLPRAAVLGAAAGLLFAGGDLSVKLVTLGGGWLAAVLALIPFYTLGTIRLQSAFQRGDALTAAGLASLATNLVPICAGFFLFGESLPGGSRGGLELSGFVLALLSAAALARPRASG